MNQEIGIYFGSFKYLPVLFHFFTVHNFKFVMYQSHNFLCLVFFLFSFKMIDSMASFESLYWCIYEITYTYFFWKVLIYLKWNWLTFYSNLSGFCFFQIEPTSALANVSEGRPFYGLTCHSFHVFLPSWQFNCPRLSQTLISLASWTWRTCWMKSWIRPTCLIRLSKHGMCPP